MKSNGLTKYYLVFTCFLLVFLFECSFSLPLMANEYNTSLAFEIPVSGTVTNEAGSPLIGVTILEKGTANGTISDINGKYTLEVTDENATLVISYIGQETQEVEIGGRAVIDVVMTASVSTLDEVVVVGYGTQKKVNLTGAVGTMNSKDIGQQTLTQSSQALAGKISGVTVLQNSGQPGKDETTIRVRGLGTFSSAGNQPLVLVDGIQSTIDDVDPTNIASISVLKDAASASIYGARAANGVILIETKRGEEGAFIVDYDAYVGYQEPTEYAQLVDSWTFAEMENEALVNDGGSPRWTQADIDLFRSGTDPDNYPNKRRLDDLLETGSGFQTYHHLRFSGGSKANRYSLSFGYLGQDGLIDETFYDRYNIRMNLDNKLSDKLSLKFSLSANHSIEGEPVSAATLPENSASRYINVAHKVPPTIPGLKTDGTWGQFAGFVLEGWHFSPSEREINQDFFLGNINLEYKILNNLKITGIAGYRHSAFENSMFKATLFVDPTLTQAPNNLTVRRGNQNFLTLQALVDYDLSIQDHNIHILGGYSQEEFMDEFIEAFRDDFPNNQLTQINAGATSNAQSFGSGFEWALQSYFGRINYAFQGKYLLEANARIDGSSRFPKDNRFAFFPSFSAGWRISEEGFFPSTSWIYDLKIRGSWGELGNQEIGNYPFQQVLSLGQNYPFAGSVLPGAAATSLPNEEITWETTRIYDFGLDASFFDGKLDFTMDYFNKRTEDILYNISSSLVLGVTPAEQNAGIVENTGVELTAAYRNSLGGFSYHIGGNIASIRTKVLELAKVEFDISQGLFVGERLQSIYGYVADGLFTSQSDIDAYPSQPFSAQPGDIRYMDINGPGGVPDGVVDANFDRKVIGSEFPKYTFGATLGANFKGFDFSMILQGVSGVDDFLTGLQGRALHLSSTPQKWMYNNRWTTDNPNPNAQYPRLSILTGGHPHNFTSSYWLRSASFLRINNLQIGYNLPSNIADKIKLRKLRIYVSSSNLYTFDGYYEGWDPEVEDDGGYYPPTRVLSLGINAGF